MRFSVPGAVTNCTLWLTWQSNSITFQGLRGAYEPTPAPGSVIANWTYALKVPQSGDETVRLNLWLEFKERMLALVEPPLRQGRSDSYSGEAKRAHGEAEAGRLLARGAAALGERAVGDAGDESRVTQAIVAG